MPRQRPGAHWVGPRLPEKTERELWLEVARAVGRFAAKRAFADIQTETEKPAERLPAQHPGKVLREEFLHPLGLSAGRVAKALRIPRTRIERLATEEIGLSTDTALRLARYFGTSADFWIELKSQHERVLAEDALGETLEQIQPFKTDQP